MENKKQNSYNFNSIDLLIYIWNKRMIFLIVGVLAAVASIVASVMITPMFRSTVIMFPTTSGLISKQLMGATINEKLNLHAFGEEEQSEQLLQVLHSDQIRSRIIEKYNLMEHYEINPGDKFPVTELLKMYNSNVTLSLTEYMAVEVSVMDSDPEIAANIANDISYLVDTVFNSMKKERAFAALELVEKEYARSVAYLESMQDSMAIVSDQLANKIKGPGDPTDNLIRTFAEDGGDFLTNYFKVRTEISVVASLGYRVKEARIESEQNLPYKFVVEKAVPAEKKAYPKKSLIVIVSTLSAFLFTLIILIVIDNIKARVAVRKEE